MRITLDLRWSYFQVSLVKINQAWSKTCLNLGKWKSTRQVAQKRRCKTATLGMGFLNNQFKSMISFSQWCSCPKKASITIKMLINHQTFPSVISPSIISLKEGIYVKFERHAVNKKCGKKVAQAWSFRPILW